jgi:hypothetical protein
MQRPSMGSDWLAGGDVPSATLLLQKLPAPPVPQPPLDQPTQQVAVGCCCVPGSSIGPNVPTLQVLALSAEYDSEYYSHYTVSFTEEKLGLALTNNKVGRVLTMRVRVRACGCERWRRDRVPCRPRARSSWPKWLAHRRRPV